MKNLLETLQEKILICDGANGTMFYAGGISPKHCYEYLNIERPDIVADLHKSYLDAGADIIETNSFAANSSQLLKFGYENLVSEINETAAKIARKAAGSNAYVGGSIGPLDKTLFEQNLSERQIYDIYKEQALALANGGADFFILETFSNLEHIRIALSACKKETMLPVIAQMTFANGTRTSFGNSIHAVVKVLTEGNADVIGANCGNGPAGMREVAIKLAGLTGAYISAQPNAGYPEIIDGRSMYLTSPEYFARHAVEMVNAGINIIGGCCGTTPDHISLLSRTLKNRAPAKRQKKETREETVFARSEAFFEKKQKNLTNIIVELLPPKKADTEKLIDTAAMLKSSGARVLSFPDNPLAQVRMNPVIAAGIVKKTTGLETIFHYTCRDRNMIGLQSDILGAYALGLRYVLAVTGDPASMGNNPGASSVFDMDSVRLVKLIDNMRKSLGLDMRIGVAFNANADNIKGQIQRLKRKIDAGAEFALTQPVFDMEKVNIWTDEIKGLNIPVYLGILPLVNKKNAEYLHNEVPGIKIPDNIRERMDIEDKTKARREGINIALEIITASKNAVSGFYIISPLHKYDISAEILKQI
jgi:methionine synthase / methylenetetrahydrofolate reductase(NADPH)